jgi:hypothetical protein
LVVGYRQCPCAHLPKTVDAIATLLTVILHSPLSSPQVFDLSDSSRLSVSRCCDRVARDGHSLPHAMVPHKLSEPVLQRSSHPHSPRASTRNFQRCPV